MPGVFSQMFFSARVGSRQFGWSEGHYRVTDQALPDALVALQNLADVRKMLCGAGVWMPYLRVSKVDVYRDSQVGDGPIPRPISPPLPRPPLQQGIPSGPDVIYDPQLVTEATAVSTRQDVRCDMPWSGLVLRFEADTPYVNRRSITLRGLPDYVIQSATDKPIPGRWADALDAYILYLKDAANGWGFRTLRSDPPGDIRDIANWTTLPESQPICASAMTGITQGAYVRIRGSQFADGGDVRYTLDGKWQVDSVTANDFKMVGMLTPGEPPLRTLKKGKVQPRIYVVLPYKKLISRRWGERKTGSPFDRPHGITKGTKKNPVYRVVAP